MRVLPVPLPPAGGADQRRRTSPAARAGRFAAAAAVVAAIVLPAGPAAADLPDGATWTAVVNDRSVETTTAQDPVRLAPGEPARVSVTVANRSDQPVAVSYVRLEGAVLGLSFYVYTTRVDLEVPAGDEQPRTFEIDLLDLGDQASGLIPSRVVLLDDAGEAIAAQDLQVDVRGQATSVYAVFGMVVGGIALVLLAGALWRLATGRLHHNRWRRGLTLAAPGLGLGFLLTFSLSALRIASPEPTLWAMFLLGGAAIGFAAGYLTPTPGAADEFPEEPPEEAADESREELTDELVGEYTEPYPDPYAGTDTRQHAAGEDGDGPTPAGPPDQVRPGPAHPVRGR
jgi:hypothetical protein